MATLDLRLDDPIYFTITLDDGETITVTQESLEVQVFRDTFEEVLEREYFIDFPERKPID